MNIPLKLRMSRTASTVAIALLLPAWLAASGRGAGVETPHKATEASTISAALVRLRPTVTERRPNSLDGRPAYAQDDHWLDSSGETWAMREQGVDRVVWLYQEPTALPIDEIGGTRPIAAFATKRLSLAYTGPLLAITRGSDASTMDVGFNAAGGLDEPALAAFCAHTECRVAKWYDQSGRHNDATQPLASARPAIRLSHRVGDAVSVIWDFEMTSGAPPRWLILPKTMTIDSGNMGILWTGRFHNASMISPLIELGTDDDAFGFGFWDAHGDFYIGDAKHLGEVPGHAALTPSIGLISASPQSTVTNYRNHSIEIGKLASTTHTGGLIGRTVAFSQYGMMELSSLILYDRPLSSADRFYGLQAMGETFHVPQQQQDVFVADGDSISQGIASLYLQSYQRDMERLLPSGFVFYNAAWAGKTLDGPGGLLDRYAAFTSKLYNPAARNNILTVLAGTNDLEAGRPAKQIFDALRRYAIEARSTGFRVVVSTVLPRRSFTPPIEVERGSLNAMIVNHWREFSDGLVDLAADHALGADKAFNDPTVYISDGTHLTDYGYQTVARDMAEIVDRVIQP